MQISEEIDTPVHFEFVELDPIGEKFAPMKIHTDSIFPAAFSPTCLSLLFSSLYEYLTRYLRLIFRCCFVERRSLLDTNGEKRREPRTENHCDKGLR